MHLITSQAFVILKFILDVCVTVNVLLLKVVAVLQLMREFIDKNIFHHDIHRDSLEGKRMETLKQAVLESLKIAGSEIRGEISKLVFFLFCRD